jgi:hypothetical protein
MIGPAPCGEIRLALAVYVLGAAEPADRGLIHRHLAGCAECRQELASLAGLPALLLRVTPEEAAELLADAQPAAGSEPEHAEPVPPALLARMAGMRRSTLRRRVALAAAVGLIAGAGAVAGWQSAHQTGPPGRPPAAAHWWARTVNATNPLTGASLAVRYAPAPWGLELSVRVSGIPAGTTCEFEVLATDGHAVPAGSWTVGGPNTWYPASASVPMRAVRRFLVVTGAGILVSAPVS